MAHNPQTHPHPHTPHHPTLDTDSPASASSSTLITPLPLDSDSLAHKVSLSSPDLVGSPDTGVGVGTRKRPSLSLSLGDGGGRGGRGGSRGEGRGELRGGRGVEGRGESRPAGVTGAAPEGRMSGKGFIEPHRSHLPRRARTTVRKGAAVTGNAAGVEGVRVTSTPTPAGRRTIQHLQSPTETSTVAALDLDVDREGDRDPDPLQTGLTTLTEPPTSSALPPQAREPTTPTPLPNAHVGTGAGPTRSTLMSNTIDAVLASAQAQERSSSNHHPALGLTMSLAALANASKAPPLFPASNPPLPSSNPLLDAPVTPMPQHLMSLTLSQNAAVVGSPIPNSGGVLATPGVLGTPGYAVGQGPGVNLPRRHTRMGRRGRSASPGPALAFAPGVGGGVGAAVTPATAGVIRYQEGLRTPLRAHPTSRTPATGLRRRHGSASRTRTREFAADDLRVGRVEAEAEGGSERERQRRKEERRVKACVQRVGGGVGGRVEVGFLEEEWDLEEGGGWFEDGEVEDEKGERRGESNVGDAVGEVGEEERRGDKGRGRKDKDKGKGKAPYVLIKVVGTSSSSSRESSGSSSSSSSSSSSESDNDTDTNADPPHPPHPPNRPTTLRLALPSERSAYADGVPSLSGAQLREACAFVGAWLGDGDGGGDSGEEVEEGVGKERGTEGRKTERRKRVRVRVLAPRWRPEEAMGVVLCYLAGLGSGRAERAERAEAVVEDGKVEGGEVNDLAYYAPGAALPSDPTAPIHLPTPDVYTYSPLHVLAMRLLDDDSGWMGRGALYEARARLGASASALRREDGEVEGEKDVFGPTSVPVDGPRTPSPLTPSPAEDDEAGGGSDDDTLGSSTEDGGVEQQQQPRGRGRTRGHAREGAEWRKETLRSASLPAIAPVPSRSRALSLSLPQPKEKEKERRAKTRERGDLATPVRNGGERKGEGWMGEEEEEGDDGDDGDEEWTGLQDTWRGVLSYDGLVRLAGVLYGEGWVGREMGVS